MDLSKIYIGFTNDGQERLLKQIKVFYENGITSSVYKDLNTKEVFDLSNIDLKTLIPYSQVFQSDKRYCKKRKVVKNYQIDRSQMIDIENLFYGNLNKNGILENDILWESMDGNFKNLRTGEIYLAYYIEGISNRRWLSTYMDTTPLPKHKVLELDYKKELVVESI